jgi:hypothetical protein
LIHQNIKEKYKFKKEKLHHPMFKLPSYHSTYRVRQKSFFLHREKKQKKNFYAPIMMRNGKMNIVFSTNRQKSVPRNPFQQMRFIQPTTTAQQIVRTKIKTCAKPQVVVVSHKFLFKRTFLRRKKFLTFLPKLLAQKKRRRCRKKRKPKRKKVSTQEWRQRGIVYKKAFRKKLMTAF